MGTFNSELDSAWRKRKAELGRDVTQCEGEHIEGELFDSWVAARRFDELIKRIHRVHDVCGGSRECAVLGYALREERDIQRLHTLFRGLLNRRTKAFWDSWPAAESGHIGQMVLASQRMASAMETYLEYFHSFTFLGMLPESEELRVEMMSFQARIKAKTPRK